jgi:uncharacterized phiE125 gp8 family phage protein
MIKSVLNTGPLYLPISLERVKKYLRVDGSEEDSLITSMIKAATLRLEALADRKFVFQTCDFYLDTFPKKSRHRSNDDWWDGTREGAIGSLFEEADFIQLPFGPLNSITGITTTDDAGTATTFAATNYNFDQFTPRPIIKLKTGMRWPSLAYRDLNGIKVTAVLGLGQGYIPATTGDTPTEAVESTVPEDIQCAIEALVGKIYEHRGDELPEIPVEALLFIEPYRRIKVGC